MRFASSYHPALFEGRSPLLRSTLVPCVVVVCLALAVPTVALAQTSDDDQAHAHFQVAASYYEQADYESALREFLEAYRLSQRSQLFYNLSLCYQQLGDLDHAVDYLSRYLHDVPEIPNRASLETRLENLRARQAAHEAAPPPDPEPVHADVTDTTDSTTTTAVTPPPPTSTGDSPNVGAIASFSVAGVGLILGAIFTGLAASEDSRIAGLPCAASRSCPDSELSGMRTDALVADIMWGVSLAGAAVGLVLLLVNPGGGGDSAHASLRFGPGSLTLAGSF
jgi:hypothetical protein